MISKILKNKSVSRALFCSAPKKAEPVPIKMGKIS
tara:strand:+ start:93 stop:197 length:105 start_codon:yes stop_codon:yes gene_type:complete